MQSVVRNRNRTVHAVVAVLLASLALTGCGRIVKALGRKAINEVAGHNATLNAFTSKVQTSSATSYAVTYTTTGSSPATIEYAASPPNDFYFSGSGTSGRLIQNSSGDYACDESTTATWSCLKLDGSTFNTQKAVYALYSGSYWIDFLKIYGTAAGLAGVSIKASTMTVNGFNLSCVVINGGKNNPGTSTWCVTSQGVLGYVQVASGGTAFEIKSYTASPATSMFSLPAGATVSTIPPTPTTSAG